MNILLYALKVKSELLMKAYQKILDNAKNYVEQEVTVSEVPEYA